MPQGMSYARLAGLPDVYGLYGAFVPVLIYAALGSSPQLVSHAVSPLLLRTHCGISFLIGHVTTLQYMTCVKCDRVILSFTFHLMVLSLAESSHCCIGVHMLCSSYLPLMETLVLVSPAGTWCKSGVRPFGTTTRGARCHGHGLHAHAGCWACSCDLPASGKWLEGLDFFGCSSRTQQPQRPGSPDGVQHGSHSGVLPPRPSNPPPSPPPTLCQLHACLARLPATHVISLPGFLPESCVL